MALRWAAATEGQPPSPPSLVPLPRGLLFSFLHREGELLYRSQQSQAERELGFCKGLLAKWPRGFRTWDEPKSGGDTQSFGGLGRSCRDKGEGFDCLAAFRDSSDM